MNFQNTDVFKDKSITVDAEALALVVQSALNNSSLKNTPTAAVATLGVALETMFPDGCLLGKVVIPKVGKNNLRAGNTAYPSAVVICTSPFIVASEDGLHYWKDQSPEHFTIVYHHPADKVRSLQKSYVTKVGG